MQTTHTRHLSSYLYSINFQDLKHETIQMAKMCIQDFLGVAIAGSTKAESAIWKKYYCSKAKTAQASTFEPEYKKISYEQAAALNAVFGHVMDMDDLHNASITHLGVVTIPTAFALGQYLHKSGAEVIEAVVAGYETGARIGEAINPSSYKYWHTTGVVGSFSSGVTASKLLQLTEDQLLNCLGSAGTQAAGLWEFINTGSMSKVLHTANANVCGIRSAELAKLGFTGAPTILEGDRGFVKALAPDYSLNKLTDNFDKGYEIEKNSFKPYACCRHTHSANYCIEKIMASHDLNPDNIVSIIDDTYSTAIEIADNPYPTNPYAAKFSLQYCIAASILLKDLSDRAFTAENINNPQIKNLMKKVKLNISEKLDNDFKQNPNQWSHHLTIHLKSGQTIMQQIDYPIGDFNNPFDLQMADRKFRMLTKSIMDDLEASELLSKLHVLEEIKDINELFI